MMITFNDNEKKLKDDLNRDIALPLWQLDLFSAQPTRLWQESFRSSEEFLNSFRIK